MADTLHLSVLDQSPVRAGGTAREALLATVELARAADRLGYSRYWLAEHHNSNTLASASPEVLIPVVAGATERIRVGSGGVMLTHYSALKVAEQFRMLETLFPGRIDIGLGRAPGSDGHTANALRHGPGALPLEAYPSQVADLIAYMGDTIPEGHRFRGIRAIPAGDSMPAPWLLGSAYDSAQFAAQLGIGFAFAQFISPDGGQKVVQAYRDQFRPSALLAEPRVIIGTPALCADTVRTYHIADASCIDTAGGTIRHLPVGAHDEVEAPIWLPADRPLRVGLTAGASTPNNKIGEAVARIFLTRGVEPSVIG